MVRCVVALITFASFLEAQSGSFPLESVAVKGSALPPDTVRDMAGLRLGTPIDEAAIKSACRRLQETGMFAVVGFSYAPGPKQGYAVTLNLTDQPSTLRALVDVVGVDGASAWTALNDKFPSLHGKAPEVDAAQQFLAHEVEKQLAPKLDGQHLVARMESDLKTGTMLVVIEPENLPQISALKFTGTQEFESGQLAEMLRHSMGSDPFTERRFRMYLDGVLRQAYEEHGMYRVQFNDLHVEKSGPGAVTVTTAVKEGQKFKLGEVQLIGDNLPTMAMLKTARFQTGTLANWRDLQQKILATEVPLKRTGYIDARSQPERVLVDDQLILNLKIAYINGPLYRFGHVQFAGLPPKAEADARKLWQMRTGDVYDLMYSGEFLRDFSKSFDLRPYKLNVQQEKHTADRTVDVNVVFQPRQ